MAEVMKLRKDLSILKISEDEAITVYIFLEVVPSLFGGKKKTKSDITYLPTYLKFIEKSFHTGLVYDLEKMLDPMHRDIKLIIAEKYQRHLSVKALGMEMALRSVYFFVPCPLG